MFSALNFPVPSQSQGASTDFKAGNSSSVVVFVFVLLCTDSHSREFNSTDFAEGKKTK